MCVMVEIDGNARVVDLGGGTDRTVDNVAEILLEHRVGANSRRVEEVEDVGHEFSREKTEEVEKEINLFGSILEPFKNYLNIVSR